MKITQTMEQIMAQMKRCGVTQDGGIVILCLISEHEIEEPMLAWMQEQRQTLTESKILEQVLKLSGLE